jgi:hypothetical protein
MNNSWTYDGGVSSAVSAYDVSDYSGTANNAERSLSVRRVQRQLAVNRVASDLKIASEKITGASGGYIRINFGGDGKTAALLIMDTEDISTAQNVWVFNQNGLGHFPNGYDPEAIANLALTMDGEVVAERIAGQMISGVGIENVDTNLTYSPQVQIKNGSIDFNYANKKTSDVYSSGTRGWYDGSEITTRGSDSYTYYHISNPVENGISNIVFTVNNRTDLGLCYINRGNQQQKITEAGSYNIALDVFDVLNFLNS